ncbi:MAG: lipid-binding protein, partial [Bacteroidetes bacterium]|nr:lipid-binding protein [Bacteroidota bacterium]
MKTLFIILFALGVSIAAAQTTDNWTLKQSNDGIKIYTADVANSKIKALKVET